MQIDFHHAVIYVLARLAGFEHKAANIVAYSSQYVDDANNRGVVLFDNGRRYARIASSHKVFDVNNHRNVDEDCQVWIPFHFLPGNNGAKAGEVLGLPVAQRLLCMTDSPVAEDMWKACLANKAQLNALHRLGITAHVYADTWAHRDFVGVPHKINSASNISHGTGDLRDQIVAWYVRSFVKLGHGAVGCHPDLPYLVWEYRDGFGKSVQRDNPADYLVACRRIHAHFCYYRGMDVKPTLLDCDVEVLNSGLRNFREEDSLARHKQWLNLIADGRFSFGHIEDEHFAELAYTAKGKGSWKFAALGTDKEKDSRDDVFRYDLSFEASNWKLFHDALKSHELSILNDILPEYQLPVTKELAKSAGAGIW